MGAVSVSDRAQGRADKYKVVEADVTFSNDYATGGDTVAVADLGLRQVLEILIPSHDLITKKAVATTSSRAGKTLELGGTSLAPTLKVHDSANTEVSAATNLASVTIRVRFLGH